MNREEFNKLTVNEQVTEFNKLYKEYKSIKKVAAELGISKNTISSRFSNAEYTIFEGVGYVKNTNTLASNEIALTKAPSEDIKQTNKERLKQFINSIVEEKLNTELERLVNRILENSTKKVDFIELDSRCEGESKYRSLGAYEDVLKKFIEFCKSKKPYTQIDLLSQAMIEFMDKYK